jgi:hypothetical protein
VARSHADPEKEKLLWAKNVELALASEKVALLTPSAVRETIADLVGWSQKLVSSSTKPEQFVGQWPSMVAHHFKLVHHVTRAARLDLGSPPLPRKDYWRARESR